MYMSWDCQFFVDFEENVLKNQLPFNLMQSSGISALVVSVTHWPCEQRLTFKCQQWNTLLRGGHSRLLFLKMCSFGNKCFIKWTMTGFKPGSSANFATTIALSFTRFHFRFRSNWWKLKRIVLRNMFFPHQRSRLLKPYFGILMVSLYL